MYKIILFDIKKRKEINTDYLFINFMNTKKEIKKDCMFQYALGSPFPYKRIIENTSLITREKAEKLWNKYYDDCIKKYENGHEPQMCIWINCKTNTNYHTLDKNKSIDYRDDLIIENGKFYIKVKRKIA